MLGYYPTVPFPTIFSLCLSLSFSVTHRHTHTLSLSLSLTHKHTHTHTHTSIRTFHKRPKSAQELIINRINVAFLSSMINVVSVIKILVFLYHAVLLVCVFFLSVQNIVPNYFQNSILIHWRILPNNNRYPSNPTKRSRMELNIPCILHRKAKDKSPVARKNNILSPLSTVGTMRIICYKLKSPDFRNVLYLVLMIVTIAIDHFR